MNINHLNRYLLPIVLLTDPIVFSSTHCARDFLLEGLLPSKNLHLKIPLIDFLPKCTVEKTVIRIKNGGFFVKERIAKDFQGVFPVKQPSLLRIPPNFFPENREGVFVKRIDGRTLCVRENRQLESSQEMHKTTGSKLDIFGTKDRCIAVTKPLLLPFRSIALLRMNYFVFPGAQIMFYGTGFRNKLNQLVTTEHNFTLEEKDIKDYCVKEGIALKDYSFKKNNCTVDVIFGARWNRYPALCCSYFTKISASYSRVHSKRDFSIIQLPQKDCHFLDENVGAVGFTAIPDSPKDHDVYIGKSVMLAGYPEEKMPIMHSYFARIKEIDANGIVSYTADTIPWNSGSPGFLLNDKQYDVASVCLIHTHQAQKLNAGEKVDNDLISFMTKYSSVKRKLQ